MGMLMSLNVTRDARKPSRPQVAGRGRKPSLATWPLGDNSLPSPKLFYLLVREQKMEPPPKPVLTGLQRPLPPPS